MSSFSPPLRRPWVQTQKIVLANGVFDIFHIGHLRYLQEAARMGGALIVSVTRNANVNKGDGMPLYDELERLSVVASLRCVSAAILCDGSRQALEEVKPHIFVKGREYLGKILPEDEEYCRSHGIEIRFTDTETKRPRDRLRKS